MTEYPSRVLVVHMDLLLREVEALEVHEIVAGLLETEQPVSILATNGRDLFRARLEEGVTQYEHLRPLWRGPFPRADVVYVHMPFPLVHLAVAVAGRLHGALVVCSPMSMLSRDFAGASWFKQATRPWARIKPVLVRTLATVWGRVAHVMTCLSDRERELSGFSRERSVLAPWPMPVTPLSQLPVRWRASVPAEDRAGLPIAFVSRFDVHRKGIDRLCRWVEAFRDELPRPAVLLLAHGEDVAPPGLDALVECGLIEWDRDTRGLALADRLEATRGVMLLSRWEAQPRALREAASLGLPTVSTPPSLFEEIVGHLGAGAIVDGDDPADIQRGFRLVATQQGDAAAARQLFDRRRVAEFMVQVFSDVAAGRRPPASYYTHLA